MGFARGEKAHLKYSSFLHFLNTALRSHTSLRTASPALPSTAVSGDPLSQISQPAARAASSATWWKAGPWREEVYKDQRVSDWVQTG